MRCPEHRAEVVVERRFVLESTAGPMEHVKARCAAGEVLCCAVAFLSEVGER